MSGTIPEEIAALQLPDEEQVVIVGGATMELHGLRIASDIDMVVSLRNWRHLRDTLQWKVHTKPDGRRYLQDSQGRFDVWRWWFNPQDRSRILLSELMKHSIQHPNGFYYPTMEYLATLKAQRNREKDLADIRVLTKHN